MPDLSAILAHAHQFLGPAEAQVRAQLDRAPDDPALRFRLGEVLRQRGDLGGARAVLRDVVGDEGAPAQAAAVLAALDERPIPDVAGVGPAPFALRDGALDDAERDALWEIVRAGPSDFTEVPVSAPSRGPSRGPTVRRAVRIMEDAFPAFAELVAARVGPLFREAWANWGLEPFEVSGIHMNITGHADGGFFRAHQDRGREGHPSGYRRGTFLYYFHRTPPRFSGGDLLLIDTDLATRAYGPSYTRVTPDDGRLLLFPGDYFHQVTPIATASAEVEDARLAITGWVDERPRD